MLTDLLWFFNAKHQYENQKRLGLAGLIGLLLPIFVAWKWNDWFYPLFKKLGFVAFAERHGMISDMPIFTFLHIAAAVLAICLLALLGFIIVGMIMFIFGTLGSSNLGVTILAIPVIILLSPIILPIVIREYWKHRQSNEVKNGMIPTYKKDPELRPLLTKYKDSEKNLQGYELYAEQRKRHGDEIQYVYGRKLESLLNRAVLSIETDRNWAIGYCISKKQNYILFPNPLPIFASQCAEYIPMRPYSVIYKFNNLNSYRFSDDYCSRELHVPALPIEFIWDADKQKLVPSIPENAKMVLQNLSFIRHSMGCNHLDFKELQDNVSQRTDVFKWNKIAHTMLYFIPRVFPYEVNTDIESAISKEVKNIPNADVFYSLYAADVQECEQYFKEVNQDYRAIQLKKFDLGYGL